MLRGDVFELRSPKGARGHEQQGRRYGIVLQADELLVLSTVIVAPTSTSARPASFRPAVEVQQQQTRVLVEQLGAVDRTRLGNRCGRLTWSEVDAVDQALRLVLSLRF